MKWILIALLACTSSSYSSEIFNLTCLRNLELKNQTLSRAQELVRKFNPNDSLELPLSEDSLEIFRVSSNSKFDNFEKKGWDGLIRYGKYNNKKVILKFYKTKYLDKGINPHKRIKQSVFIQTIMNSLGMAPKVYGFEIGEKAKNLAKKVGITEPIYAVTVMEKINYKYHYKESDVSDEEFNKMDELMMQVIQKIKAVSIVPDDYDFMLTKNNDFIFIDFDFWEIITSNKLKYKEGNLMKE